MDNNEFSKPQEICQEVLLEKYAKGDEQTADDIFKRVAKGIAAVEKPEIREAIEEAFLDNMRNGAIGAGRIMSAAGTAMQATLMNCFVIPVGDSIQGVDKNNVPGIYEALREAAETMRRGGGVGYDFSRIRPESAIVKGTLSRASGPCSYMDVFDSSCKTVESAGCFTAETLIDTTEGLITIEEIVNSDSEYFVNTHAGPKKVTAKFKNGVKPIWRIYTKYGYSVRVTPEHKFAVFDKANIVTKPLKDILAEKPVGAPILLLTNKNVTVVPQNTWQEKEAYLVGAFYGNGCWRYNDYRNKVKGISISNNVNKQPIINKIVEICLDIGLTPIERKIPDEYTIKVDCYSTDFFTAWKNKGVDKGDHMRVPEFILKSPKNVQASFIAGIIESDGYICEGKSNINIRMTTYELLHDIQIMLTAMGIPAKLRLERHAINNWKTVFSLSILGITAQRRFNNNVGNFLIYNLNNTASKDGAGYGHAWSDVKHFNPNKTTFANYWSGDENRTPNLSLNAIENCSTVPDLINTTTDFIISASVETAEETYDLEVEDVHLLSGNGIYTSNSRRGAQMGILKISHPDIQKFIVAKRTQGRWNNFNVSVFVTDEFIEAVKNDDFYELFHEVEPSEEYKQQHNSYYQEGKGWIYKKIKAAELWETIMKSNYDFAEPGILFENNINNDNNLRYTEYIDATNPCVTGDTVILTSNGYVRIDSVVDQSVNVWNGFEWSEVVPKITGTNQEIFDLEFSDGTKLACTPYHKFILEDGTRVEAKDLHSGNKLAKFNFPIIEGSFNIDEKTAYTQGFYSGDGQKGTNRIWLYNEKTNLIPYLSLSAYSDQSNEQQYRLMASMNFMPEAKNFVPDIKYTITTRLNWFSGLVDSDGSVCDKAITIWSVDREFLLNVKLMLNTLGVSGNISLGRKAGDRLLPNGQNGLSVYDCQDGWRITISGSYIAKLKQLGFITHRVNIDVDLQRNSSRFIQLTFKQKRQGLEPIVYCFNEEKNHSGIFNGIMTAQCAEQPLPPYGCCDLGPIDLTRFVIEPFTDKPEFDFKRFKSAVALQVRFLDNVLDATVWPLDKQKKESDSKRRIGVGFTGLGNALAMMGVAYNSLQGLMLAEKIAIEMRDSAYDASVALAMEKGPFPLFNAEKYLEEGTFASRLPVEIKQEIRNNGIRNSHLLSIAPTGTVSLAFCDNASNGIEPPYSLAYIRKKVMPDGTKKEYPVIDYGFKAYLQYLSDSGETELAKVLLNTVCDYKETFTFNGAEYNVKNVLPASIVTAMELTVDEHLAMLQVVQPFIDTSISKTVNVPADYPFDDFKQIYTKAHAMKLKGVSTYRPNSILGSVLSLGTETKKEEPKKDEPVDIDNLNLIIDKRPEDELPSITKKVRYMTNSGEEAIYITLSFFKSSATIKGVAKSVLRPIEVFISAYPDGVPTEWIAAYGRNLSLLARSGLKLFCKALQDNRKVKSDKGKVRYGWYIKPDGTKVPRFHESDVACIAYAIQDILYKKGLIDLEGNPLKIENMREVIENKTVTELSISNSGHQGVMQTGKVCKECGASAVIKKDGCSFCTNCGMEGECGG